jgi:hypothetical protein
MHNIGRLAMMGKAARLPPSNEAAATTMPIRQLLDNAAFNPEEIVMLRGADEIDQLLDREAVRQQNPSLQPSCGHEASSSSARRCVGRVAAGARRPEGHL